MISKCTCTHESQDTIHGNGNRVFNKVMKKSGDKPVFRCTVCSKEKTFN